MNRFYGFINRVLITCLITVSVLILCRKSAFFKAIYSDKVMGDNFNFAFVNDLYNKYFAGTIPFFSNDTSSVFSEDLIFDSKEKYLDGVKLNVSHDFFVPALDGGIVVFVGVKEGYGNVVIVNQTDGVDVWYGNLSNVGVGLYDYVSGGSLIGNSNDFLYLVFKRNGNVLDYEDFI